MSKKITIQDSAFNIINVFFLILISIICIYPFYYILIFSLSRPGSAANATLWPIGFTFENYIQVFKLDGIFNSFCISVERTVIGTVVTVVGCSLFAYIVTKPELFFRKIIYRFVVITMYFNAGLIPHYLVIRAYGLRNNFWVYILPTMISAYYIILIKTFIEQLPPSLEESAMIDGAGYLTIFLKIILPLSKPILATIGVFAAVSQWNHFFDALLYVSDTKLQPMQLLLYNYLQQSQSVVTSLQDSGGGAVNPLDALTPESVRMTITMVVTLPIVFVYPFLQKYFVGGIMMGAVKG